MDQTIEAAGEYHFIVESGLVQQGCLACNRIFRAGGASISVRHGMSTYKLGELEGVACPHCNDPKTDTSPVMFDTVQEALAYTEELVARINARDPSAKFRLLGYKVIGEGSATLQ